MKSHGIWERKWAQKKWVLKLGLIAIAVAWLFLVGSSWSDASDEFHFNWLDPDKKITVLQNRKYKKENRLLLSASGGMARSSPYRTTYVVDPRAAFYFAEQLGFEAFYTVCFNQENTYFANLKQASNVIPRTIEVRSQMGGLLHYAPWYAKINVFNAILYFDWYFTGGAGAVNTATDIRDSSTAAANYSLANRFAVFAGTGQQFHISQDFVLRFDFTGTFFRAPVYGTTGASYWWSSYVLGAGLGVRL
jgi:outer membrane beta-barrel protein